jgi:hypothetical protein
MAVIAAGPTSLPAQPVAPSAGEAATPAPRFAPHPYKSALAAVANYRGCGVRARAAPYQALTGEMRDIEAAAAAKGLGPTLERLRREHYELLSISTIMACVRGPIPALAEARRAVAAFRAWVAGQPDIR